MNYPAQSTSAGNLGQIQRVQPPTLEARLKHLHDAVERVCTTTSRRSNTWQIGSTSRCSSGRTRRRRPRRGADMRQLKRNEDPTGFLNLFRYAASMRFGDPRGVRPAPVAGVLRVAGAVLRRQPFR